MPQDASESAERIDGTLSPTLAAATPQSSEPDGKSTRLALP